MTKETKKVNQIEFGNCQIHLEKKDNQMMLSVEGSTKELFILLENAGDTMPQFKEAIIHCVKFWEFEKKELNKK